MSCPHLYLLANLSKPKVSEQVHKEECTQCFDNQDDPLGIDVCLTCFNGGCLDPVRHHAWTHFQKSAHPFTVNVKRKEKPSVNRDTNDEPPSKMAKLAIVEEREENKYDFSTTVKCWRCDGKNGRELSDSDSAKLEEFVNGILHSVSSSRQSEVKAWEEEIAACEHTLMLEQLAVGPIPSSGLAKCQKCELKENLWLCLTCGSLGCGRQQFGGVGGNGHGLQHYEETKHPVSVKLGTITPEGTADVYCYECNDSKLDLDLAAHLSTFGINVSTQTKTEKSMTELQVEHNLKFDFSLTGEDGKALEPVFGPGLTGLSNLGNSCYMASVIQSVFSLTEFQERYLLNASQHWTSCSQRLPASCVECQMIKLADGLLSGRYSHPHRGSQAASIGSDPLAHPSPTPVFQSGIKPSSFKALIGKGHEEFATMRQQDAEEFFSHLLKTLRQYAKKFGRASNDEATEIFRFGLEQRLQCQDCKRVRYRVDSQDLISVPVPAKERGKDAEGKTLYEEVKLTDSLDLLTGDEALEYNCPACKKQVIATTRSRFATFPSTLVIHAKKFQLVNWVPTKLNIPIILPAEDILSLDQYIGKGLQAGEVELPEDSEVSALPVFNEAAMAQLEAMGFPTIRCQKALLATGNQDPEAAMEWLFQHMEDPDIDAPLQTQTSSTSNTEPTEDQIASLSDMGFTPAQARKALSETNGDTERAVEWLFNHPDESGEESASSSAQEKKADLGGSATLPAHYKLKAFISHKGPSVHSGHYVAHIRFEDRWVLFNDEKVVKADSESVKELKALAYLYVFERI